MDHLRPRTEETDSDENAREAVGIMEGELKIALAGVATAIRNQLEVSSPSTHEASISEEHAAKRPLDRPGPSWRTRAIAATLSFRPPHHIDGTDIDRWLTESTRALAEAGADAVVLDRLWEHRQTAWTISADPCPPEIWCGEVRWPTREDDIPDVVLFPNSPWGRVPGNRVFELASQTAVDHMASHLYHYFSGGDFSEESACADEVRLMWRRSGVAPKLAAVAIFAGVRWHKRIPLLETASRLGGTFPTT